MASSQLSTLGSQIIVDPARGDLVLNQLDFSCGCGLLTSRVELLAVVVVGYYCMACCTIGAYGILLLICDNFDTQRHKVEKIMIFCSGCFPQPVFITTQNNAATTITIIIDHAIKVAYVQNTKLSIDAL